MNATYGNLLVSTKPTAARKAVIGVICAFCLLLDILIFFNLDSLRAFTLVNFHNAALGTLWGLLVGILCPVGLACVILSMRSGCNVYEGGVTGTTFVRNSLKIGSEKNFTVSYNDIVSVSDTKDSLVIQTKYEQLEVLARNGSTRAEALREIRTRMLGNMN